MDNRKTAFKQKLYFCALAAFALLIRLYFLLTTERTLDMDECVVGIMIKRVAEGVRFVHLAGSDYGGGHALIAYLLAPLYKIFGTSDILVQSLTVLSSVVLVLVVAALVSRLVSPATGLLTGFLLCFSPPFLKASFQVNAYIETLLLAALAAFSLMKILEATGSRGSRNLYFMLFGLFAGAALWSFEFSVVFLAPLAAVAAFRFRRFGFSGAAISLVCFFIGCSLKLNYLLHDSVTSSTFARWIAFDGFRAYAVRLFELVFQLLPRFFSPLIYHYTGEARIYSIVIYVVFVITTLVAIICAAAASRRGSGAAALRIALFTLYYLPLLALFRNATSFPRYFLPLAPFAAFAAAYSIGWLWKSGGARAAAGVLVLVALVFSQAAGVSDMARCPEDSCENRAGITELIGFLDDIGAKGIYSDFSTKWHVAFYTDERIIGSDYAFDNMPRYMPYEIAMESIENAPYVFPSDWELAGSIIEKLTRNNVSIKTKMIDGLTVIYDFDRPVRPFDWLKREPGQK